MAIQHLAASLAGKQESVSPRRLKPQPIAKWMESAKETPLYLLKHTLAADCNIVMSGLAKRSKKTLLAYTIALALASGKTLGPLEPVEPAGLPVLVFQAEDGRGQNVLRWQQIAAGMDIDLTKLPNLHFYHREGLLFDNPDDVGQVRDLVAETGAKLCIVDPLTMFMSGNENSTQDFAKVMRGFNRIRSTGCGTLFLHHLTKEQFDKKTGAAVQRDIDQELRGSSSIAGFYDQHWASRTTGVTQYDPLALTIRSKNDEEKTFRVEWFFNNKLGKTTFKMVPTASEEVLSGAERDLEQILMCGDSTTPERIREMLMLDPYAVGLVIDNMLRSGKLERGDSGELILAAGGSNGSGDIQALDG